MISLICGTWNRKQQTKQTTKLIDTGNSIVVARGEGGWGEAEDEEGNGSQIYGDWRRLDFDQWRHTQYTANVS